MRLKMIFILVVQYLIELARLMSLSSERTDHVNQNKLVCYLWMKVLVLVIFLVNDRDQPLHVSYKYLPHSTL